MKQLKLLMVFSFGILLLFSGKEEKKSDESRKTDQLEMSTSYPTRNLFLSQGKYGVIHVNSGQGRNLGKLTGEMERMPFFNFWKMGFAL